MRSRSRPLPPRMRHRLDFVLLKRDTGYSFNWRLDRETDRNSVVRGWGMKAICLRARGGPEAFAYEETPQPRAGEGEVLVRVHAAGVIQTELGWVPTWTTRAGGPRPLPVIPGHEFSGEIAALGPGSRTRAWGTWCTASMTGTATAPTPNTAWPASPMSPPSRPASIMSTRPPHRFPP